MGEISLVYWYALVPTTDRTGYIIVRCGDLFVQGPPYVVWKCDVHREQCTRSWNIDAMHIIPNASIIFTPYIMCVYTVTCTVQGFQCDCGREVRILQPWRKEGDSRVASRVIWS